jgi:hypothetical protein
MPQYISELSALIPEEGHRLFFLNLSTFHSIVFKKRVIASLSLISHSSQTILIIKLLLSFNMKHLSHYNCINLGTTRHAVYSIIFYYKHYNYLYGLMNSIKKFVPKTKLFIRTYTFLKQFIVKNYFTCAHK